MIRIKQLKMFPRWKINGVILPDEKDYIIVYEGNTVKEMCEKSGLTAPSVYGRIRTLSNNLLGKQYKNLSPEQRISIIRDNEDTIKLFMVSAILGVITDKDIVDKITERFIKVVLNGDKKDR